MKKDAFTLVEVMAIIIIISLVAVITVPNIQTVINDSKVNACKSQVDYIEKAAQRYVADVVASGNNVPTCVSISKLNSEGYLGANYIKNPLNNENIEGFVKIEPNDSSYTYKFNNENVCDSNNNISISDVCLDEQNSEESSLDSDLENTAENPEQSDSEENSFGA